MQHSPRDSVGVCASAANCPSTIANVRQGTNKRMMFIRPPRVIRVHGLPSPPASHATRDYSSSGTGMYRHAHSTLASIMESTKHAEH